MTHVNYPSCIPNFSPFALLGIDLQPPFSNSFLELYLLFWVLQDQYLSCRLSDLFTVPTSSIRVTSRTNLTSRSRLRLSQDIVDETTSNVVKAIFYQSNSTCDQILTTIHVSWRSCNPFIPALLSLKRPHPRTSLSRHRPRRSIIVEFGQSMCFCSPITWNLTRSESPDFLHSAWIPSFTSQSLDSTNNYLFSKF